MATYVFSDVHGHHRTLERLLEKVSPSDEDEIWVLGDLVDRGPDPIGVIRTCRALPNVHFIMGNHEDMMLSYFRDPHDYVMTFQWELNGGHTTKAGLSKLTVDELSDVIEWTENLPLHAHVNVNDRNYLLVHAGLRPLSFSSHSRWTDATMDTLLKYQSDEDELWIRDEFWCVPTGFVGADGRGPIVIAGHTPVPYVEELLAPGDYDRPARNVDGECQVMHLGACEATGGVADRWAIDCGAAGGPGWGRIAMIRLDDGEEFYASVLDGE